MKIANSLLLKRLAIICAFSLSLYAMSSAWIQSRRFAGVDYFQYWAVPQIMNEAPGTNIYEDSKQIRFANSPSNSRSPRYRFAANFRANFLRLSGTPFLYSVLAIGAFPSYDLSLDLFSFAAVSASLIGILLLCSVCEFSLLAVFCISAGYFLWFEPVLSDLRVGNVNQFQLLILGLFLYLLKRNSNPSTFAAGACLGLGIMFKPNLALVVPFMCVSWLAAKHYKKFLLFAVGGASGATAAILFSYLYFPSFTYWADWFSVASKLTAIEAGRYSLEAGNYSLLSEFSRQFAIPLAGQGFLLVVASLAFIAAVSWAKHGLSDIATSGFAIAISFLAAPLVWSHYYVLLLPLLLYLLFVSLDISKRDKIAAVLLGLLNVLPWIAVNLMVALRLLHPSDISYFIASAMGLLVALGLSLWAFVRAGEFP